MKHFASQLLGILALAVVAGVLEEALDVDLVAMPRRRRMWR
jgi:hypothetical protein